MDCKIVNCECGERLGVITEDGFMIGNLVFERFYGVCPSCKKYLDYEDFEMEIYDSRTGETKNVTFEF